MSKKPDKYKARLSFQEFLNLPGMHAGAYIRAYVEDTSARNLQSYQTPRVILELTDCEKRVTFDFDWSEFGMKNNINEVKTLIDGLTQFKEALEEEHKLMKKRLKNGRGAQTSY